LESIHAKRLHPRLSVFLYFTYHKAISQGDFKKDAPLARGLTGLRPEGCGRLSAAGCVSLRSGGDSACGAEGCGIALRAINIKTALRDWLSVSQGLIGILVISRYAAPPLSGCAGLSPIQGAE